MVGISNSNLDQETKEKLSVHNNLWTRIQRHGPLGILVWLFITLFRGASYAVHIFVRRDIGISSFTMWTGLAAFFWVRLFTFGDFTFQPLADDYTYFADDYTDESGMKLDTTMRPAFTVYNYVSQFGEDVANIKQALKPIPKGGSQFTYLYSFMIPLLFWFNWITVFIKGNVNPMRRGESVFFGWMYKKGENSAMRRTTLLIFDPLLPAVLGGLLYFFTNEKGFAVMLFFSAIAFFIRERSDYFRKAKRDGVKDPLY